MTRRKIRAQVRGARSVITEGQPSFVEEHGRKGKHFSGGRKAEDLDYVGAPAPDADPERPVSAPAPPRSSQASTT